MPLTGFRSQGHGFWGIRKEFLQVLERLQLPLCRLRLPAAQQPRTFHDCPALTIEDYGPE